MWPFKGFGVKMTEEKSEVGVECITCEGSGTIYVDCGDGEGRRDMPETCPDCLSKPLECICGEINARHCPVHSGDLNESR